MTKLILIALLSVPAPAEVLAIGDRISVKAAATGVVHVSSRRPIQVIDRGEKIEIWAKRLGSAMISQGSKVWWVYVVSRPTADLHRKFSRALSKMMGLELAIEDDKVIVHGHLLRARDWQELARLQRETGGRWNMRAQVDALVLPDDLPQPRWPEEIRAFGLGERAGEAAQSGRAVRLQLTIAEVLNSAADRLGFNYDDGQSVQVLPRLAGPDRVETKLAFLAQNGEARILAKPSLVARAGTEAEFLAGGEFAVRTSGYRTKDVSWKRHGLWLRFRPDWRGGHLVALKIDTEFSHPDYSQMVDGIPSLKTHKTSTNTDLEIGRTLLLAGLIQSQMGRSQSGIKGLKDIPLFGALFSSRDYSENHSELMVFVKPLVAESESEP